MEKSELKLVVALYQVVLEYVTMVCGGLYVVIHGAMQMQLLSVDSLDSQVQVQLRYNVANNT